MQRYRVIRTHIGDREYLPGDEREAAPGDVEHLVQAGCLSAIEAKVIAPPENKGRQRK